MRLCGFHPAWTGSLRLILFTLSLSVIALTGPPGLAPLTSIARADGYWSDEFFSPSGIDGGFRAAIEFNGDLVVAGDFRFMGRTAMNGIARWDGREWHPLGDGFEGPVEALAVYQGRLVAAGEFRRLASGPADFVEIWDGSRWTTLGGPMDDHIRCLAVSGDTLVAGGDFASAAGRQAPVFAVWDGSSWGRLQRRMNGNFMDARAVARTEEGWCAILRTGSRSAIVRLRGGSLEEIGLDPEYPSGRLLLKPTAMMVDGGALIAAGSASEGANGDLRRGTRVYRRENERWFPLGDWLPAATEVFGITRHEDRLILLTSRGLLQREGEEWITLRRHYPEVPTTAASYGGRLLTISGIKLSTWDGARWEPIPGWEPGQGMNGSVEELVATSSGLLARGTFEHPGTAGCALRAGGAWSGAPSEGLGGAHLLAANDTLYAWGTETLDGRTFSRIRWWDGAGWPLLAEFEDADLLDLASHQGRLAAALSPTQVNRTTLHVRFGADWRPVPSLGRRYPLLESRDGRLIVGRTSCQGIYTLTCETLFWTWEGTRWRELPPLGSSASNFTGFQGGVIAAGDGGMYTLSPTRWDLLHSPIYDARAMVVFHGDLIVGGSSYRDPDIHNLARWDGTTWQSIGGGVDGRVYALWVDGDSLWIGGDFLHAGRLASTHIALWVEERPSLDPFRARAIAPDQILVEWNGREQEGVTGLTVRHSRGDYPMDPRDGLPLPNGQDGFISLGADGLGSFVHEVDPDGATYYYSAFYAMEGGGHSSPAHTRATAIDQTAPSLSLTFALDPDAPDSSSRVDSLTVFLRSSEPLAGAHLEWSGQGEPLAVVRGDPYGMLWTARAPLDSPATRHAMATGSDASGYPGTASSSIVLRAIGPGGGILESEDGVCRLRIPAEALDRERVLGIHAEPSGDPSRSARYVTEPAVTLKSPASVTFSVLRSGAEQGTADWPSLFLNGRPLATVFDPERDLAVAPVGSLGTLDLAWDSGESTEIGGGSFLSIRTAGVNPFRTNIRLAVTLQVPQPVTLEFFDASGRLVRTLHRDLILPGTTEITWSGYDRYGFHVQAGVYFCRVRGVESSAEVKLVRMP